MRPHVWIREERQISALWILFVAVVVVGGVLDQFRPPVGWLALEFPAWSDPSSATSPGSWKPEEREAALFGLGLDFLFLVLYPAFLSLLCGRAGCYWDLPAWLARTSLTFSGLALIAAPLDALENIGLYFLIKGESGDALQWFITAVAAPKWLIGLAAALVGLVCLGFRLKHRWLRS